jgi:flavin-dependent dehydrogenase
MGRARISGQTEKTKVETDVVVLGGGLAGLTLTRQLLQSRPDLKITVLEKSKFPVPEAGFKVGESTVEIASNYLEEVLNLKDYLKRAQLPKFGLRYFFPQGDNADISKRYEIGNSRFPFTPSYQLDRGRLENDLAAMVTAAGAKLVDDCKVQAVTFAKERGGSPGELHEVEATKDGDTIRVRARWVVDASGRASIIKRKLQLKKDVGHKCNAAWFRIATELPLDAWSDDPRWRGRVEDRRWLSTNHLMGKGYWVWFIPLSSGNTSVGIVADGELHPYTEIYKPELAFDWLRKHEPQAARIVDAHGDKVMDFLALKNFAHGCKQLYSADRWCLTGEAGVFVDPFYSPGSDFISISNTFIHDLILRDLKGEDIATRTTAYNRMFLSFFEIVLMIYEGLYPQFGDGQLMMQKILWDSAIYLGVTCQLFFNRKWTDLDFLARVAPEMGAYNRLIFKVNHYFKHKYVSPGTHLAPGFLDLTKQDCKGVDLNRRLATKSPNDEHLIGILRENIEFLEAVAEDILQGRDIRAKVNMGDA